MARHALMCTIIMASLLCCSNTKSRLTVQFDSILIELEEPSHDGGEYHVLFLQSWTRLLGHKKNLGEWITRCAEHWLEMHRTIFPGLARTNINCNQRRVGGNCRRARGSGHGWCFNATLSVWFAALWWLLTKSTRCRIVVAARHFLQKVINAIVERTIGIQTSLTLRFVFEGWYEDLQVRGNGTIDISKLLVKREIIRGLKKLQVLWHQAFEGNINKFKPKAELSNPDLAELIVGIGCLLKKNKKYASLHKTAELLLGQIHNVFADVCLPNESRDQRISAKQDAKAKADHSIFSLYDRLQEATHVKSGNILDREFKAGAY